jgi:hypothetical protein
MLVERPNNAIDVANDRRDLDQKEMIVFAAVLKTAFASAGTQYFDILVTSSRRVTKREIPQTKNLSSMPWFESDASLMYAGTLQALLQRSLHSKVLPPQALGGWPFP